MVSMVLTGVLLLTISLSACGGKGPGLPVASPSSTGRSTSGRTWILTRRALTFLLADPATRAALSGGTIYEILRAGQPATTSIPVVPTVSFPSYATMKRTIDGGELPGDIKAVMYDAEVWSATPADEQADPARFYRLAADLAHAHGLRFLAAPALNLVQVHMTGPASSRPAQYLTARLPALIAPTADVFEIQAQSLERDPGRFASFVATAAAQVRAANPRAAVLAGVSSNPPGAVVTASELTAAMRAAGAHVDGFWVNIPGRGLQCPTCNPENPGVAIAALSALRAGSATL
jgi:hypothetical protein